MHGSERGDWKRGLTWGSRACSVLPGQLPVAWSPRQPPTLQITVDSLNRLVGDLIHASRSGAGRLELRRSGLDLVQEARACVEKAQMETTLHTVRLETPEGPLQGAWDKDRLGQIFSNLLSNAIKYSPDGGEIVVRIEDEGQQARVSIVDRGIGIAANALPRLFDRFYRIAGATGRVPGLGLHITRDLVESHGGRIWATSAGPGQGSSFTFTLPYRPVDEPG
jgi:signal transduction histidine kinase